MESKRIADFGFGDIFAQQLPGSFVTVIETEKPLTPAEQDAIVDLLASYEHEQLVLRSAAGEIHGPVDHTKAH